MKFHQFDFPNGPALKAPRPVSPMTPAAVARAADAGVILRAQYSPRYAAIYKGQK